jgi:DnaJ domain
VPLDPDANVDAYRTLGLQPGSSKAEVKRAYRLLAKAFHPDSAGEAALPRFLAIHEAYDRLITGRVAAGPKPARPDSTPAEPWRADPARARQARERARTARGGAASAGRGSTGTAGGARPGASGSAGAAGSGTRGATGTRGSGRRHVRKATMGSTSYDEARDANDPTWSGASWYGPSSGEYWIVNPREYADPRKHGPEYQSRARRPLPGDAVAASPETTTSGATETADEAAGWTAASPQAEPVPRSPGWGSRPSTSSWSAPAEAAGLAPPARSGRTGRASRARLAGERPAARERGSGAASDPFNVDPALGTAARGWLGGPGDDPIRRLGLALVAWPPLGLAAAALIGAATGCSSSSACAGPEPLLPLLAQAGILGLLLLLPPLTRILAGGALGLLVAVLPLSLVFVAMGGTGTHQSGLLTGVLLAAAWLAGVAWAAMRAGRRGSGATRAGA